MIFLLEVLLGLESHSQYRGSLPAVNKHFYKQSSRLGPVEDSWALKYLLGLIEIKKRCGSMLFSAYETNKLTHFMLTLIHISTKIEFSDNFLCNTHDQLSWRTCVVDI